jgi:hypothetical protein
MVKVTKKKATVLCFKSDRALVNHFFSGLAMIASLVILLNPGNRFQATAESDAVAVIIQNKLLSGLLFPAASILRAS